MTKCKHEWHFVKEKYLDLWDELCSIDKFQAGLYAKFVCCNCGEIKLVLEKENKNA